MARRTTRKQGPFQALAGLTLIAPLLVLVAAIGVRADLWSLGFGYDLLTMRLGWWLSFLGAAAALVALVLAVRDFGRFGLLALLALLTLGIKTWLEHRQLRELELAQTSSDQPDEH